MGLEDPNALRVAMLRIQQVQLKRMTPITRALISPTTDGCFRPEEAIGLSCMSGVESGPTQSAQDQREFGARVDFVFQQMTEPLNLAADRRLHFK